MTTEDDLRAVATELLRLYDWRKELAKEEEDLQNTPIEQIDVREVAMREASDFEASPLIQRRAALDKKLRQYGREKKAAWERLRALLARPRPMPRTNPQHDCEYIDNPEKDAQIAAHAKALARQEEDLVNAETTAALDAGRLYEARLQSANERINHGLSLDKPKNLT